MRKSKLEFHQGIVKAFDPSQGIGFIEEDNGETIFVHYSTLPIKNGRFVPLKPGQKVRFIIVEGVRGPQAANIEILNN